MVLILSVLVAVALSKSVTVLEPEWFTIPAALLVIPVIAPEPLMFNVPVFVRLANAVVIVPEPSWPIYPELASVVTEIDPVLLNVPALANIPNPASDELIAKVPLLVNSVADEVLLTAIVPEPLVNDLPEAISIVPDPVGAKVKLMVCVKPILSAVLAPEPFITIVPLPVLVSVIIPAV